MVGGIVTAHHSPFDFTLHDRGEISLVRVLRVRYTGFSRENIQRCCEQLILQFRELAAPEGISKELWVKSPDRAWRQYQILPDTIEEVEDVIQPETSIGVWKRTRRNCLNLRKRINFF